MRRYRFVVSDAQWAMCEKVGKRMMLEPKQVFTTAASVGLAFFDMSLNPSAELLRAAGELPEVKGAVDKSVAGAVMPLSQALREAEKRDKVKRRRMRK